MLRVRIADMLRADPDVNGAFSGRIYPQSASDPTVLDPLYFPAAFDDVGEVLPTVLVRDGGTFAQAPNPAGGAQAIVDVLLWQQHGRATIDAALPLIRRALEGLRADTSGLYAYKLVFAGESSNGRDQGLADAEHGWQRWQTATYLKSF